MKTRSEEKRKPAEQKGQPTPVPISREQIVALHKQGVAFLELVEELRKTTEYDQHNPDIDHSKEDCMGDLRIIFLQLDKHLNEQINGLRRIRGKMSKAINKLKEQEEK